MSTALLEWGVATLALPGEAESGDLHLVKPFKNGALAAAVDGLGHGSEAAVAAKMAISTLEKNSQESLIPLAQLCHQSLLGTRGVVLSMAVFNSLESTMTWLGVGNVEGSLLHADAEGRIAYESLLLRRGVVGGRLPPLNASIVPVVPGDTLVLVTDGIRGGYEPRFNPKSPPQQTAEQILAQHNMGTDDAMVLVVRYLGNNQ